MDEIIKRWGLLIKKRPTPTVFGIKNQSGNQIFEVTLWSQIVSLVLKLKRTGHNFGSSVYLVEPTDKVTKVIACQL